MPSSSVSPVSFVKSATATVGRPPGICRSQTRQVARPAAARPSRRNAVPTSASLRKRRGRSTRRRAERSSESQVPPSLGLASGSSASAAASTFATGRGTPAPRGPAVPPADCGGTFGASHINSVPAPASATAAGVRSTGRLPVSISPSTIPAAHTSARSSTAAPAACSGAMYAGVPAPEDPSVPSRCASPKSSSFTRPSSQTNTLAGLRSRCRTPRECACASPSAICSAIAQRLVDGQRPLLDPPGQRLAPEQFHHEVRTGRARPHVEDGDDGRVVQLRDRLGLLLDPLLGNQVLRPPRLQGLERDRPRQLRIERLVHRPEAPAADLAADLVAPDEVPGPERLPPRRGEVLLGGPGDLQEEP